MVEPSKPPDVVLTVPGDLVVRLATADDKETAALREVIGERTAENHRALAAASRALADAYIALAGHVACRGVDQASAAAMFAITHALRHYADYLNDRATNDEDYAARQQPQNTTDGGDAS